MLRSTYVTFNVDGAGTSGASLSDFQEVAAAADAPRWDTIAASFVSVENVKA